MKRFLRAIADVYDGQSGPMTVELSSALRSSQQLSTKPPHEPGPTGEILDHMMAAHASAHHPLLNEIARVRNSLVWYSPSFERIPEPIGSRLSVVELLGPDGLVFCDHCRLGLFLQMPDLFYPGHAHAADELYLVLSGTADWQLGGSEAIPRSPGSFIHHPSGHWHAMNTRSEPLLAIWGWTGDIGFDSYAIEAVP
ncbi:dimethylsulfonioproprionate lyase family protein [Pelagibius sp. Alg239-R121]|uniref:dimethylsulfonioproprionate lyase family protein n=1 Tax=Pelagibius sp. Alg239-R121 TaxID=2993448 RepID=UPI0024A6F56B|nr:dimethylsulfonioproprionate lyase family protein [Pelagibius sp. Alg239-R121]